jgi:hypothetical protein
MFGSRASGSSALLLLFAYEDEIGMFSECFFSAVCLDSDMVTTINMGLGSTGCLDRHGHGGMSFSSVIRCPLRKVPTFGFSFLLRGIYRPATDEFLPARSRPQCYCKATVPVATDLQHDEILYYRCWYLHLCVYDVPVYYNRLHAVISFTDSYEYLYYMSLLGLNACSHFIAVT